MGTSEPTRLGATPPATEPKGAVVGRRKAQAGYLPQLTLVALRWARANDWTSVPSSSAALNFPTAAVVS